MLETIREFVEEKLVIRGEAAAVRAAHARHFAQRITDVMTVWDSPDQREAYNVWFAVELANLRSAFRCVADHGDLDNAAAIAAYAAFLGYLLDKFEPISWAEELFEPARAANHPRLTFLYVLASMCYSAGRFQDALRYAEVAAELLDSNRGQLPYGIDGWPNAGVYGQRADTTSGHRADACPARARSRLTHPDQGMPRIRLNAGNTSDEAMTLARGLIEAAEATSNPMALCFALLADGFAFRDTDPAHALKVLRRGLAMAQETGKRKQRIASGVRPLPCRSQLWRPVSRARVLRTGDSQSP